MTTVAKAAARLEQAHNGVVDAALAWDHSGDHSPGSAGLRAAILEHRLASQAFVEAQLLAACSCRGGGCDVCGVVNPNDAESERDWLKSGRST